MNILFQGDSITDAGRNREATYANADLGYGYVTLVAAKLNSSRDDISITNRGVSGNRTEQIYDRWQEDTLSAHYDVLSLLCGINDVGFDLRLGIRGDREFVYPLYDEMLYRAKEKNSDAKIILMTPFVFKMNYNNPEFGNDIYENYDIWHERVVISGEIAKEMATKYNAELVPLFDVFKKLTSLKNAEKYSVDCVHLTTAGHAVIAQEWLKAFEKLGL